MVLAYYDLLFKGIQPLLAFKGRQFALPVLQFRDEAFRSQSGHGGNELTGKPDLLLLGFDLLLKLGDFGFESTNGSGEPRLLGFQPLFFRRDLILQQGSLRLQGRKNTCIHVLTVCRDLARLDREQILPLFDLLSLLHVDFFDRPLLRGKDFGRPARGCQVSNHRLFPGVLSET